MIKNRLGVLGRGMRLPMVAAPMFLVSGPELVVAACRSGIAGAMPTTNARTVQDLERALQFITRELDAYSATAGRPAAPWILNLITHSSYDRLSQELALVSRYRPPVVITALGSPAPAVETVHAYGGLVLADVNNLSFARKAAAAGVDGLILVSAGAGGHTGRVAAAPFVAAVREFFGGIIGVSGGICSGATVRAAELIGADLACAGTPFIVAAESAASPAYRGMVTRATLDDLVLSKAFTGAEAYYMRESIIAAGLDPDHLVGKEKFDIKNSESQVKAWKDIWSAGQGVGCITAIESTAEIVARFEREYAAAVAWPPFVGDFS